MNKFAQNPAQPALFEPKARREFRSGSPPWVKPCPKGAKRNGPKLAQTFKRAEDRLKYRPSLETLRFVTSLSEFAATKGFLTQKQFAALERIADGR